VATARDSLPKCRSKNAVIASCMRVELLAGLLQLLHRRLP
jgi:hypothetical protein